MVALHHLGGGKAQRNACCHGVVFYQVHDAVQAAVHGSAVVVLVAKILPQGPLLVFCHVQGMLHQLVDAFVLGGRDGQHGNAQYALHLVHTHRAPVVAHLVHHVQGQHHGGVQLHQLHGQV